MGKKLKTLLPAKEAEKKTLPIFSKGIFSENPDMSNLLNMMEKLLHWAAIIDSSDDAIISKSIDGFITSWNRGAQHLYGYTPEEVIGKPVSILMPPEKEDDFPYIMHQLQEGNRIEHYETKRKTKDGRVLDVSITVSPIRDSQGNIIGASKIARDITERKEMERRRDEFISIVSHELKTPITSQKAFGELLEQLIDIKGNSEFKPYIQKINQQTKKLEHLIQDLLELSRVEAGRLKMEHSPFEFDELVDEVVENTQMTTSRTIIKKGSTKKMVVGDKERLGQVLTNLLSNAVKYSPDGSDIVVSSLVHDKSIITSVRDYGIGISKKYHQKIFERFYRVSGNDEETYPGMGIGLNVSNEIVTRHGGKMWIESQKGKGSTFYFSIPISI